MTTKSAIEWTEATWSPVIGCTKVSKGCTHCYARREVETRWSKNPKSIWYGRSFSDVLCREDAIGEPLSWRKPRTIFVCPRADLFHEAVSDEFIDEVFAVMAMCPQHTFQVLTKRADRMWLYMSDAEMNVRDCVKYEPIAETLRWPLPNVQLGVSVEDQPNADKRIQRLLATPAATRWISAEPLLGAIDVRRYLDVDLDRGLGEPWLNWVVAGGESGPLARPSHPDWFRSLRHQCGKAGVPFMFKQWGEWIPMMGHAEGVPVIGHKATMADGTIMGRAGKRRAGRLLDGVMHDEYPRPAS
ncbi:MAG: phage Gp37/Gp68 family protein [Georgfuchsia sp.]